MRLSNKTQELLRLALLSALAVSLSLLESVFAPVLPPGAKAGLSNIVTMLAAASLGLPSALVITAVKAVFALVMRGVTAFGMSAAGGLLSALVLWLLFRFANGKLGLLGISMLGAAVHNAAQGVFAVCIFGEAVLGYLPILLLLSVPAGLITGTLLAALRKAATHIKPKGNRSIYEK